MLQIITAYISTAIVFAVVDIVWISQVLRPYIFNKIESLIALNFPAAILFYFLYIAGIIIFAVYPTLGMSDGEAIRYALIWGALFGFFCYMTYDLTNMATLRDWAWSMVLVDVAWGTTVTAISALGGVYITRIIF
jgi:uncharacterized membrane protein